MVKHYFGEQSIADLFYEYIANKWQNSKKYTAGYVNYYGMHPSLITTCLINDSFH